MKAQELVGSVIFGIILGAVGTNVWIQFSGAQKTVNVFHDYLIDTKTEMKNGTIKTTILRVGGPYGDHSACYDAKVVADRTAGSLASFRGGPDDFACKSLTEEAASSISAGSFER